MIVFGFLIGLLAIANGASVGRIIGGWDAPDHKYPYQVSLRYELSGGDFHFCSGSIVNEYWILTAGHCVENPGNFDISYAVAGTNYLNETGERYKFDKFVKHPKYINFYHDDLALVRVKGPIKFHANVKTVVLPTEDIQEYGGDAEFAGWGSTVLWGPSPNALQELPLRVISHGECLESRQEVTKNHVCSYNKYGQGICHGDSGGPLVYNGAQVGIASYVVPCAVGYPDVWTRVFSYVDWIKEVVEEH